MPGDSVEIVRRLFAANRSGPPEETREIVLSLTDPAVEFRSRVMAVEGAEYRGDEGIGRYFADLADAFREWRNEPSTIEEVSPDTVLVESTFHGVGRDSGMEVELRSVIAFVLSDGRVVRCLACSTREEALEAAGLSE